MGAGEQGAGTAGCGAVMAYFEKEELRQAKQMSAIEFLKRYRPEELVRCGTGEYELRSHDSFKISENTSLWHWKSRDIGGKSALDYLVRVEGVPFTDAVRYQLVCQCRNLFYLLSCELYK